MTTSIEGRSSEAELRCLRVSFPFRSNTKSPPICATSTCSGCQIFPCTAKRTWPQIARGGAIAKSPFSSEPDASITPALGIGKPEVGMPQIVGEALEMVRTSKRDDGDLSVQLRYLLAELPELREELLAVELTEVAEQNQNGGPPHRSARAEDLSVKVRTSKARSMCIDADRSEERSKLTAA